MTSVDEVRLDPGAHHGEEIARNRVGWHVPHIAHTLHTSQSKCITYIKTTYLSVLPECSCAHTAEFEHPKY